MVRNKAAGDESNLVLFGLATLITAVLIIVQKTAVHLLGRFGTHHHSDF